MKFLKFPISGMQHLSIMKREFQLLKNKVHTSGDVNSNEIETILVEVYPPLDRDAPDLGKYPWK